jgi:hypothetical protein
MSEDRVTSQLRSCIPSLFVRGLRPESGVSFSGFSASLFSAVKDFPSCEKVRAKMPGTTQTSIVCML